MTTTPDERARQYGLTIFELRELQEACEDRCWICGQPESVPNRSLAVDHDHRTGQVRGLLCTRCNTVIGWMKDDHRVIRAAADYVERAWDQYRDYCRVCRSNRRDGSWAPWAVVESDGQSTQFTYECDRGHRWTCNWATRGLFSISPPAWKETRC